MRAIFIATSNPGKLRDFAGAAHAFGIEVMPLPGFSSLPIVEEDGTTFAANAQKKAEFYSRCAGDRLVLADDSGLEVAALHGAPGIRSARYSVDDPNLDNLAGATMDERNNLRLLRELDHVPEENRGARFVCVLAAAREGKLVKLFEGEVHGVILRAPRGNFGFGYDPLFLIPKLGKTMAELTPDEKARISHRGAAFKKFLEWYRKESDH